MKWNEFTKRVKKDMSEMEMKDDYLEMWGRLKPELAIVNKAQKKKNRGLFWIFPIGIICLSGLLYFLIIPGEQHLDNKIATENSKKESVLTTQDKKEETKIKETASSIREEANDTKNKTTNNIISSTNKSVSHIISHKKSSKQEIYTSLNVKKEHSPIPPKKHFSGNPIPLKQIATQQTTTKKSGAITGFQNPLEKTQSLAGLDLLNLLSLKPLVNNEAFTNKTIHEFYAIDANLLNTKDKFSIGFRFNAGVFNNFKTLTNKTLDDKDWQVLRNQSETPLETKKIEGLIEIGNLKGFHLASGISIRSIAERTDYTSSDVTLSQVNGLKYKVSNLAGSYEDINGDLVKMTIVDTHYKFFNQYNFIDIPLLIGYTYKTKNWNLMIEGGPYFNVKTFGKGTILANDGSFLEWEDEAFLKEKISTSFGARLLMEKRISSRLMLQFGPSLSIMPDNVLREDNALKQNYKMFGATVGIKYRWR